MNGYRLCVSAVLGLLLAGLGATPVRADMLGEDSAERIATEAGVTFGYRGVGSGGTPNRAREYDSLDSSPLFKAKLFTDRGAYHLDLDVDYLNEDDYSAEVQLNTKGLLQLDLRTERFYHNLDHLAYDNGFTGGETGPPLVRNLTGTPAEGSRPDALFNGAYRAFYTDQNPTDRYGLRLDLNEVKLKIKCPDYPAHLNISYWRYEKEGGRQQRFVGENCATACHLQSKTRPVSRVTEEFKVGADAHAGFLDLAIEAVYRAFRDREDPPLDYFGAHAIPGRTGGYYDHDENPDSRLTELTLSANTAPSGGLVGSASFTIGERENRSDLTSVTPIEAETDYTKTAADVTYTPSQNWTFNLRYRLLDMESSNSARLSDPNAFRSPVAVREAMDLTRAWYEAIASYRPTSRLTVKAEFRREDIERSDTGAGVNHNSFTNPTTIDPQWDLPGEETVTRVKLGFNSRMLEKSALKFNGWVALQRDDDPAYGTSFAESREMFLATNYSPASNWGMLASAHLLDESNDRNQLAGVDLERERRQQTASVGGWVAPADGLSFDLNYGFLRTAISQDLLFGAAAYAIEDEDVDYEQRVHTVSAGATWQARENLTCRIEGYHIRSQADYDPNFPTEAFFYGNAVPPVVPGTASSTDLREISELDLRQNGIRGRVEWQIDQNWSCGIEASYDKYDDRKHNELDGSVQTCMVSLSRRW